MKSAMVAWYRPEEVGCASSPWYRARYIFSRRMRASFSPPGKGVSLDKYDSMNLIAESFCELRCNERARESASVGVGAWMLCWIATSRGEHEEAASTRTASSLCCAASCIIPGVNNARAACLTYFLVSDQAENQSTQDERDRFPLRRICSQA